MSDPASEALLAAIEQAIEGTQPGDGDVFIVPGPEWVRICQLAGRPRPLRGGEMSDPASEALTYKAACAKLQTQLAQAEERLEEVVRIKAGVLDELDTCRRIAHEQQQRAEKAEARNQELREALAILTGNEHIRYDYPREVAQALARSEEGE